MWPWAPCIRQDTSDVPEKPNVTPFCYRFRGRLLTGVTVHRLYFVMDFRWKREGWEAVISCYHENSICFIVPEFMAHCNFAYTSQRYTYLGGISGRRKAVHGWKPFVRTGLHKLIAVCCLRRQFAVVVITEAVAGQRISQCLQSCTCKEAVISAWLSRTMWIMDYYFFKGFMRFTLFIIAPVGLTWEYSHGLRWMCV